MKEVEEVSHTLKPVRHLLEEYSEARYLFVEFMKVSI